MFFTLRAAFLLFTPLMVSSYYVKVGIVSNDPDTATIAKAWSLAQNYSMMMSLEPVVHVTQWWNVLDTPELARVVCNLTSMGVDALVFLGPPRLNYLFSAYSDHFGLPFVAAAANGRSTSPLQVNIMPDTSKVAAAFIKHFKWSKFVFIYDSENGPNQLQYVLKELLMDNFVPQVEAFWRVSDVDQAHRYITKLLQPNINRHIILATSDDFAEKLAAKLARERNYNIMLLTAVGIVERFSSQGFFKLTKFSVVEAQDPVLKMLENRLKTIPSHSARGSSRKVIPDNIILHFDSSNTLNTMFNQIAREHAKTPKSTKNIDCLQDPVNISSSFNDLQEVVIEHGATGKIIFDARGFRMDYKINVMQTTPFDVQKIGTWSYYSGLQLTPTFSKDTVLSYEADRRDPPIRVTTFAALPFIYVSENGKFSGFTVDLLDALADEIKRDYTLSLVKDGKFGVVIDGQWQGMIGELIRGEADLAAADLTKTPERMKVIDFTKGIMTAGLNILMKKPPSEMRQESFGPFTFLTIWSAETWILILLAISIYSAAGYGIARFIGSPGRLRALETKGTDQLSPCGSVWFTIGSLFCRDTGIYPRNLTHRLWALLWWIFCIFISLLYVSMLTSALVKSRNFITTTHSRKSSQQMLKECLDTGYPEIGVLKSGATMRFFLNSEIGIYRQFGRYLQENPQVFVKSYPEGIQRVKKSGGKYAMVSESATSLFVTNSKPCDTLVTSGFLTSKPHAMAVPKNSTLKELIDHGILTLLETGKIRRLYEKWWHNETSGCEDPNLNLLPKVYNNSMTLYEVSGVFYLLITFTLISLVAAAIEYYIKTRNIRVE